MTVAEALGWARSNGVDRLDAHLLLAALLQRPRSWLIAHDDEVLEAAPQERFEHLVARRAAGEPVAYLLGEKEFHGLMLSVGPAVLVPRPDTEVLVDWALELLAGDLSGIAMPRVIDLGTGSGAIALAVKQGRPAAVVTATDLSADALGMARANAARHGLDVQWAAGSWWDAVPAQHFHLVLSNPPYIAGGDHHLDALRHEPLQALTPGGDGLGALRHLVQGAGDHLEPGGWMLLEHGHDQAEAVRGFFADHDFRAIATRHDVAGQPRCTGARL